jgi:hypothetical protein
LDRAFWIIWYDLPDEGRAPYLSWLHDTYMPKVLARRGVLWGAHYASEENVVPLGGGKGRVSRHAASVSVPAGDRFILIFGGNNAHVFATPDPSRFHAQLPEEDRTMLALRVGERTNIMIEEARVHGPESAQFDADMTPSPCIQLGSFNAASYEDEDEMTGWYAQWRLPSLEKVPGCVRVRKLVSVAGWAKHACFYEFTSVEARNEHFVYYERSTPEMEAWSTKVVRGLIHAPRSPNLARRIWPPVTN